MIGSSPPFSDQVRKNNYIYCILLSILLSTEYAWLVANFCLEAIKPTAYRRRSLHRQAHRFGMRWKFQVKMDSESENFRFRKVLKSWWSQFTRDHSSLQQNFEEHLSHSRCSASILWIDARCCPCSISMPSGFLLGVLIIWSWKNLMIGCWYLGGFLYQYPKQKPWLECKLQWLAVILMQHYSRLRV